MSSTSSAISDHVLTAAERTRDANLQRAERRGLTPEQVVEQFSRPEIDLMKEFMARGLEPLQQYPVGPWDADFYFPEYRVAVEVDGAQHFEREQWARDRRRDRVFWKRYGIRTLRVPARFIDRGLGTWACVDAIMEQIAKFEETS